MDFDKLLATQKELNQHCDRYPAKEELNWAILAEIGELAQAVKGKWCWWKRYGLGFQVVDKPEIAAELADILCFLLTGCLQYGDQQNATELIFQIPIEKHPITYLTQLALLGDYVSAIQRLFYVAEELGVSEEELLTAYYKKVEINKQRWTKTNPSA